MWYRSHININTFTTVIAYSYQLAGFNALEHTKNVSQHPRERQPRQKEKVNEVNDKANQSTMTSEMAKM